MEPTLSQTPLPAPAVKRVRELRVLFSVDAAPTPVATLGAEPVTVGRDPGAGIALDDRRVSRIHVVIAPDGDGWAVVDQGSRNGIFVDGRKVARARLSHGTVIRLGATLLLFIDVDTRSEVGGAGALVGGSAAMRVVRGEVRLAAPQAGAVLITGETGVGKERVAAELHRLSGRRGALVPVNCAAIAASVAESELFGHVAGAFTGAQHPGEGLWTAAHNGTLFLDEVGELATELQAKLLRALALGEVRPVGATEATAVDARVVAATNRDLDAEAAAGRFRSDLLARLSAWRVHVPPLRERRDDILPLAKLFLAPRAPMGVSADAAEALLLHRWQWNVRELEQTMAGAAARAARDGESIALTHLPPHFAELLADRASAPGEQSSAAGAIADPDDAPSAADLERALLQHGCNVSAVARLFGKERRQVYRWMERAGIDIDKLRGGPGSSS